MAVPTRSTAEKSCSRIVMLFVLSVVNVSSNVYFVHSILDNCQKFSYSCLNFFALDTFPVFISYDDATVFFVISVILDRLMVYIFHSFLIVPAMRTA